MNKIKVSVGLATAVVVALAILYFTGYLYVGVKSPEQRVVVQGSVCDANLINKYNAATKIFDQEDSKAAFKAVANDIEKARGYAGDPSCNFMLASTYVRLNDSAKANSAISAYKKLVDRGALPDVRVNELKSPDELKQSAEAYSNIMNSTIKPEDSPGGG